MVDNIPTVLSLDNNIFYDDLFVEQLKTENILRTAAFAKQLGNPVIGFTGYDGGKLKAMTELSIHVPVHDM